MKKVFLLLTMLLFAFTGVTRANVQQNRDDQVIEQGFEDGLGDWTMNHCHSSSGPTSSYGGNTGNYAFRFYYTANYPQYLISPELDDNDGVNFTFYAARYSSSYPETFKVGYSSTTNEPTEFTWDSEVTCTTMYGAGAYQEYSYDFPAGTKYVSIACTSNDQFYMFVDDITVTATEPAPAPTPGEIVEVTIGDGTGTTYYFPIDNFFNYSCTEQVYLAEEIGIAGTINSISFYYDYGTAYTASNVTMYMKNVSRSVFASTADCEPLAPSDVVWTGNIAPTEAGWYTFTLDTPFEYDGTSNLLVAFYDGTSGYPGTSYTWRQTATPGEAYMALRYYSDSSNPNPYDLASYGGSKTWYTYRSNVQLSITTGGDEPKAFATTPSVLDLGYRPNGAWMAPYTFAIKSNIGAATINALDFSGNYFTYNAELPATVSGNNPLNVELTTGTAAEGLVESTMTIMYSGNRDVEQFPVTAYAYDPVNGDVWENAINVTSFPYAGNAPAGIYKNYELPEETEGADAMYKVVFNNDVMFSAGTAGENAVTAIYPEGFNGQPGPMIDNNYVYNGPTINPGPMSMWFSYDYTGSNTFYGSSAGGGTIFGYRITPAQLQELGLGNCAITTVEAAAREGSYYDLMILKGGDTPDLDNMVYYQSFDNYEPFYFFDVNLDEPQFLGDDENIWVMFYSDSPYAAYCGRYPVDANNGKIWYTTNLTNWYSSTTYTPVIYTRFLELPTGREVTVNLADMKIRESKPAEGQMLAMAGKAMGTPKAQIAKANRGNRETQTLLEQGFEDGMGDWTMYNCYSSTGIFNSDANTGDYSFGFYYTTSTPQYLISPELDDNNGGTMTFYAKQYSSNYPESYKLGYSTTTNDVSAFTFGAEVTDLTLLYAEKSFDFPAGTKYVCIACTSYDKFYMFVDDITITADITTGGGTPEPPTATYQIADLYVPAGTYYVAVASTTEEFNVDMAVAEVPYPEQAYIISPYDGETNVEAPYLAEWVLGDYTEEMQVILGTQYPPQTVMIDWTDYLVESAFITDLEPNQSYFMQVNERNAAGTTYGEIIAFTTPIDGVEGFEVENDELYPGDAAVFSWNANRSFKGYNMYMNGEKINPSLITDHTYTVEGLEYNMEGYDFQVTAVYDAGESELSDVVTVYMTGFGSVSGHVYDTDVEHPIANATIIAIGVDEYENIQEFEFTTDETGLYEGEILAGEYVIGIVTEGYENEAVAIEVFYNQLTEADDIITHEFYYPLGQITATEQVAENNVLVEWSWDPAELLVDFETGDFSQAEFTLPAQYPWAITTTNPYEGTYCMKSTCEGQASASSIIEATVDVPFDAKMGFYVRTSSESNYDKFHFYIDGVEQGSALSGQNPYTYKEYSVSEGTHTYKWEYTKDSSVNSNDDCIYVDNITMYRKDEPLPPTPGGQTFNFDDSTLQGWTTIDNDGDGYTWSVASDIMSAGYGHNASTDCVLSQSYDNNYGALTPDNYLVSPSAIAAQDGAAISFWACAQDASWASEHFGVAVSTTGNTSASAFTTIQEWTMTSKGAATAENSKYLRGTREQGTWYQYTVDLSSYAGQNIYVAIRHFNCTDMFYIDVDDITLADGSELVAPRGNREFVSFNLYRRNNVGDATPELIAEGIDGETFEYTDEAWATLSYGEYQWGISATYDGYSPLTDRNRETATFGFENGSLEGWTGIVVNTDGGEWIHSNNNLGGYDYTELAHTGTGFAMCYSYVDYDGPYDTDAYLVSPQKYAVDANSSIAFWADNANDSYPEDFSVCVSTAATPTAASFVEVWNGGAKGTVSDGAINRRSENRYENWRSHEISLAAYAGQEIWIAFHDVNYDMYEIWIDDVTITYAGSAPVPPTPGPTGEGESEILWSNVIEKDMEATVTFNVSLNNGQSPEGATIDIIGANNVYAATVDAEGAAEVVVRKGDDYVIQVSLDGYLGYSELWAADEDTHEVTVVLYEFVGPAEGFYVSPTGWAMWEGATGGVTPTPPTPPTGILFEDDFEDGAISNWTTVDADGDGDTWQNATPASYGIGDAHSGTNCASSWSWNSYTMYPDNWMISPMVEGATIIQYYVATNTAYPDHYGIYASSTGTNTSDFTMVFEETAGSKGGNGVKSSMTQGSSREMSAWVEKNIELPAGTKYVAFRHWNSDDMNYLFIDDVTISAGNRGDRAPLSYKLMLDGEYIGETYYPFYQFDVEGMEEGETHIGGVAPLYASGMGDWTYYTWTYKPCDGFNNVTAFEGTVNNNTVTLNWTLPGGAPQPPTPGTGEWYYYDNGNNEDAIGTGGGNFWWGVMFPAGSYTGNMVTKVAAYDYMAMTGNVTIYNDGATIPASSVGTMNVTMTGSETMVEYEFAEPVVIDPSKNVWVVFYNGSGATYPAAVCANTGDANGRWVSLDGSTWEDLAGYGLDYTFMVRAYIAQGAKGEVVEISAPQGTGSNGTLANAGVAKANRSNRNMWDLQFEFDATSGYQYGVASDGEYIYTSSWSSSSTSMFYKYDMEGNFIEEFNISGCGQLRGMTYDGEYFYGVANSSTIYCVDLANHTLVGQTNSAYGAMRGITYDPVRDGFWVIGNWSGNLTLVDRTGAIVTTGATPTSASDLAYYADPDGVEHVYCLNNGTNDVDDYNIATNTITSAVFNFNANPLVTGSTGGCFVGAYDGKTCLFGDIQQSPQHIVIYELDGNAPVPPTPVEGVLGAILYRDGEFVDIFDYNTTSFTEELEPGDYTYTIRVIYDGEPDVTYWAMSCGTDETVTVLPLSVDEKEVVNSIYPNPTSGELYINATSMQHVTVFNTMGQVVMSQDVDTDAIVLNMGQFESGVYMVKVDTVDGSSVKRITVVK